VSSTAVPRKLRVAFPGAIYHVISRGDRRDPVFPDDVDRQDFLQTLAEACQKNGFQVRAYCRMSNHFHLAVETSDANLVAGMRWLLSADTIRFNHRHHLTGHVFSGQEEDEAAWEQVRRGWCLGGTTLRKEMLERMEEGLGEHHAGELRRESAGLRAERIMAEELSRQGWTEAELGQPRRSGSGRAGGRRP